MSIYDPSKYDHVMIDMETLGVAPGSCIISLGAVFFAEMMPEDEWAVYEAPVISAASCIAINLTLDASTIRWWEEQTAPAARSVYEAALRNEGEHIVSVLLAFAKFLPEGVKVWGNGANFDNALLAEAYRHAGLPIPWPHYNDRCYRTLKNEYSDCVERPKFQGTEHRALDDALHQTRHWQAIRAYGHKCITAYRKELAATPMQLFEEDQRRDLSKR